MAAGVHTPKGTYETPDQVIGKTVFDFIGEEELISDTHLASAKSGGGSGVPEGMRAVSIHVTDSSGVIGMLRAGQKVDVQIVLGKNGTEITERTALEDLQVLAVSAAPEGTSQGTILPAVTLLAGPAQADVLAAADSGARVRLTLRNPLDDQTRATAPVSLGSVIRSSTTVAAPAQVKPANFQRRALPSPEAGDFCMLIFSILAFFVLTFLLASIAGRDILDGVFSKRRPRSPRREQGELDRRRRRSSL